MRINKSNTVLRYLLSFIKLFITDPKKRIFLGLWSQFRLKNPFYICSNKVAAEFGVGKRGFGDLYAKKFKRVYGIDIEDYSKYYNDIEFIISDGERCTLNDSSVDIIFSHSVLEHVQDIQSALSEVNRLLKKGGMAYLTVDPLYFSSFGSHINSTGNKLDNWQHLDKKSQYYLVDNPMPHAGTSGHYLNKMTSSMLLDAVGGQPWKILLYLPYYENKPIPDYVDRTVCSELDLVTKGFRLIVKKIK